MFMLGRPPTLRWTAAGLVLAVAIWVDLRPPSVVAHPFAREDVGVGEVVTTENVEMRDVPVGLLDPVALPFTATRSVTAGEPVLATAARAGNPEAPQGWWSLEMEVPPSATVGSTVGVVLLDREPAAVIEGMVTGAISDGDGFGGPVGVAAFPPDRAAEVAAAAAAGRVAVLTIRAG